MGGHSFGALNYTILGVYLAAMFGIGLALAGRQTTTTEFFLAGRRMPWIAVACSMFASLTSAISYMGVPGTAYKENASYVVAAVVSPLVAPFLIIVFYPFYRRMAVTTSYEYVGRRFGATARTAVSLLFVLCRLGWLGTVIFAPALALHIATGLSLYLSIVLMGGVATAYSALGGLSAVIWTDVVQFVILIAGAIWAAVFLLLKVPGGARGILRVASDTGRLDIFSSRISLYEMSAAAVAFSFFWQLLQDYGTDQVTVQRLLAAKNMRSVAKAISFNAMTDVVVTNLLLFIGLGMFAYYRHFPDPAAAGMKSDAMLPFFAMQALPAGVSGVLITGIFAAAMSSMDSGINSISTVLVNDFVKPWRPGRTDQQNLALGKSLSWGLGIFGMAVAFMVSGIEQLLKASNTFLGLFAGPILALFLLGMFTRRGTFKGWLVGTVVAIAITAHVAFSTPAPGARVVHWIWYFPICFVTSLLLGYAASLVLRAPLAERKLTIWGRSELETVEPSS